MLRRAAIFLQLCTTLCLALAGLSEGATRPNVVLVTFESTRADRMGFLGSKREVTPNLDAFARQALVFERAYAQAPLTVVSHATILSGTYPQTNQANALGGPINSSVPWLPDLFRARGYHTLAYVGLRDLDPKSGMAQGFDRGFVIYDAGFRLPQKGVLRSQSVERSGDQVVARALAGLKGNSQPFFLWIHLPDPQAPYASYDRTVAAADAAFGKLVSALRAQKLYDDSIMVVAADHGESLGAHGEDTHGIFLYDDTILVPLVIKLPQNQMAGKRVTGRVRLLDVAPTILEAASVPVPPQMQGQSLLRIAKSNPTADQAVYSRSDFPQRGFGWSPLQSWRASKYLYVRAPRPELYDLATDAAATKNIASTSKGTVDTIASQLDGFDKRFTAGSKTAELSSSEMQKLASLGYVGIQKSNTASAATGTDPKDSIATANKVESALQAIDDGKPEKALPILQQVLANSPSVYLAQYGLGSALAQLQQCPKAIEPLRKAIELQPDSAWAHFQMGACLVKTGDYKTAAVHLEIATSRLPEFGEAHTLLAQSYDHLGRAEDAKRARAKAAQLGKKA
jgi:tetratricopeptide (TPR) repeat protein